MPMFYRFLIYISDRILKLGILNKIKELEKVQNCSVDELKTIQQEKLQNLIKVAKTKSLFYKKRVASEPITLLDTFPILTKSDLTESIRDIATLDLQNPKLFSTQTSGTTGPSARVFYNKMELNSPRAIQLHWLKRCGYKIGDKIVQIGVDNNRSLFKKLKDRLFNTHYISGINHNEEELRELIEILNKNPRAILMGYASSLYLLALTAKKYGYNPIPLKFIYSYGEMLLPHFRTTINSAFTGSIYDTYGCSEGIMVALQCNKGNYHIQSSEVVLEILDEKNNEVAPGEVGRIVLTELNNTTTPLIRYEIGDLGLKSDLKYCECGLKLPILGGIEGRSSEILRTNNGSLITIQTLVKLLKAYKEIWQFQLLRYDSINFLLLLESNKRDKEFVKKIEKQFSDFIDNTVNLNVQFTTFTSNSSKFKYLIDMENKSTYD